MSSIILLSGPIGAGKTTVAKHFVASSPRPLIYIEGDRFWPFIAKPAESDSRAKQFKMSISAMVAASLAYARYAYPVLLDYSIPPEFLPSVHRIIQGRVSLDYVVLRPSEEICAQRAASRDEGKIADYKLYHQLYSSFDEMQRHIIFDDTSSAALIAAKVREGVDQGMFRLEAPQ